jgi:hypothetical protein
METSLHNGSNLKKKLKVRGARTHGHSEFKRGKTDDKKLTAVL